MPTPPRRSNAPVELDARALREFIRTRKIDVRNLADRLPCDRSYLSKLQTGAAPRCSPPFFSRLCHLLGADDPRELMREPDQYAPESSEVTTELPRPVDDPTGLPLEVTAGNTVEVPVQRTGRHRRETADVR